jgi:hypothetical protein
MAMFERYTEQARRAIFFAHYEAVHQPAATISTAHLLIGLTRDRGSRADAVGSLKDHADELRSVFGIPHPPRVTGNVARAGSIPLDNNSEMALAYAAQEAGMDDSYYIDTDHLLRGILRFPNEATGALNSISLDIATAQAFSRRNRAEFPPERSLYLRLFGSPFRAHRILLVKLVAFVIVCFLAVLLIRLLN